MRRLLALGLASALLSCAGEVVPESPVQGRDLCAACRMPVSDLRFAAQITSPGELTLFFDDPGCLGEFVRSEKISADAVAWVADHRTSAWVRADRAVYTRVRGLATPMNHNLVTHETPASRDSDPEARAGRTATLQEIFGPEGPPAGGRP
jgi:copper chaperone NosL